MKILKKWERSIYKKMMKYGVISPKIILLLDGGVCSQMYQYMLGQLYKERGYKVAYDLSFYDEWGLDKDNLFVRNFDLLKAFPYLKMKAASPLEISVYKQKYYYVGNNTTARIADFSFLEKTPPIYLGGYYLLPAETYLSAFRSIFKMSPNVLDKDNLQICSEIDSKSCSVAVHVRRGDLKVEQYDYGTPPTMEYFKNAIAYFKGKFEAPFFYFFSDEPNWIVDDLVPYLQMSSGEYRVVNANGSDKGYMDLYLMAHCKHQIASKGTLGKYGALLEDNPEKIVVLCNDKLEYRWKELIQNTVFL